MPWRARAHNRIAPIPSRRPMRAARRPQAPPDMSPFAQREMQSAVALAASGRHADADRAFERAIRASPRSPLARRRRGDCQYRAGRFVEAATSYAEAAALAPADGELRHALALALGRAGEIAASHGQYREAVALLPADADLHFNFGNALREAGDLVAAELMYTKAVVLRPAFAEAHCNLGKLHLDQGNAPLAQVHLERATALAPSLGSALVNLGALRDREGDYDGALAAYDAAIAADPRDAKAVGNRGSTLLRLGRHGQAVAAFREALALDPGFATMHCNLLFALQNDEDVDAATLFAEHRAFAARHEAPLKARWAAHDNDPDPGRRLRVGYLSPDLRNHPVAQFVAPVLAAHDRERFETIAYYTHAQVDAFTQGIAGQVDRFVRCHADSAEALAARIRADRIDILVDLAGHVGTGEILALARKPAPVQATWIGYPGTTGLDAMDYRITDAWIDPPGLTEALHTEKLARLPGFNVPFPVPAGAPQVEALPALDGRGPVVACLNNPRKIGPGVAAAWSRILAAVPAARLLLGGVPDNELRERLRGLFAAGGTDPSRLDFEPHRPFAEYLALYRRVDLALDPFPYNGGTTSFHCLWMGVPFVTLAGDRTAARSGASVLARAGLQDWVAGSVDDYVARAVRALADLPALDALRRSLRGRILADADNSAATVTRRLEEAYRRMWRRWCEGGAPEAF